MNLSGCGFLFGTHEISSLENATVANFTENALYISAGASHEVRGTSFHGAGGAGAFTVLRRHPVNRNLVFAGTDVAGVFRSRDGGGHYQNVANGLTTGYVADVEFLYDPENSDLDRVMLATKDGIFISDDAGETWEPSSSGMEIGSGDDSTVQYLRYPILSLAVDPKNPRTVWAGIGVGTRLTPKAFFNPYQIYVSRDAGASWSGVLSLNDSDATLAATVYEITVNPFSCTASSCPVVYVATDKGLYVTSNDGESWSEIGSTLPVSESVGAVKPNLRAVKLARSSEGITSIFVGVMDNGYYSGCEDGDSSYKDVDGVVYRGGVYRSDDNGATWESLNIASDGSSIPMSIRCSADYALAYSTTSTMVTDLEVNPADPEHLFITMDGRFKGLFEYNSSRATGSLWMSLSGGSNDDFSFTGSCEDISCYYDAATMGLWNQHDPHVFQNPSYGLDIDFTPSGVMRDFNLFGSRGVTEVKLQGDVYRLNYLNQQGMLKKGRGEIPVVDWQEMRRDDLHDDEMNFMRWRSTGVDDACNYGGLEIVRTSKGRSVWFLGMADYGIISSENEGASWTGLTGEARDIWPFTGGGRDGHVMLYDEEAGRFYVAVRNGDNTDANEVAVMMTEDAGETWSNVGGYCGDACEDRGLTSTHTLTDMALDYSSPASSRRILAATKRGGIYAFESSGSWSQITSCPTDADAMEIVTSPDFPNYAFATFQDGNNAGNTCKNDEGWFLYKGDPGAKTDCSGGENEGVFLLELDDLSCTRLHSPSATGLAVYHPSRMQIGRDEGGYFIISSGEWSNWPVLMRSAFSFEDPLSVSWEIVLDFYYATDSSGARVSRTHELVREASDSWWSYLETSAPESAWEYQDTDFNKKEFVGLWVHPGDPEVVLGSLGAGEPNFHGYLPQHIYVSLDAGQTFTHASGLDHLPLKNIRHYKYDHRSQRYFLTPGCGQVMEVPRFMKRIVE